MTIFFNVDEVFAQWFAEGRKTSIIRRTKNKQVGRNADICTGKYTPEFKTIKVMKLAEVKTIQFNKNGDIQCGELCAGDIAEMEGFDSVDALRAYIEKKHGLPFRGYLHIFKKGKDDE